MEYNGTDTNGKNGHLSPPPLLYLLSEGRAALELASSYLLKPLLDLPKGDGHPVLVFPGFIASGVSTQPLRTFLAELGYTPYSWKQGRNLGLREGLEERMRDRVSDLKKRHSAKVSLIGWSLGGVYAREVARQIPDQVRLVITLGSPFGEPKANHPWRLYDMLADTRIEEMEPDRFDAMRQPPPVPSTAVYSETDGIAAWQSCMERPGPRSESVEVFGSHCGLGVNVMSYTVIADRLAQTEGEWQPFRRSGARRHFFRRPRYHLTDF